MVKDKLRRRLRLEGETPAFAQYLRRLLALSFLSFSLASCSGDSRPSEQGMSKPTPTTVASVDITPLAEATDPVAELEVLDNSAIGGSVFMSDNFMITITGFGLEAAYKGCDTQGQCLEIPRASDYDSGIYTWENAGYTYQMQSAKTDYVLEVRDPQGRVLVDERVDAVLPMTLMNLTQGDRACYVELMGRDRAAFTELGSFEVCGRTPLIGQPVWVRIQEADVMAESCQGDPSCTATERLPMVMSIRNRE